MPAQPWIIKSLLLGARSLDWSTIAKARLLLNHAGGGAKGERFPIALVLPSSLLLVAVLPWGGPALANDVAAAGTQATPPQPLVRPLALNCSEGPLVPATAIYRAENNAWGKGTLKGWSQCIGLDPGSAQGVRARWTWDWLDAGDNVKAYPEVIVGTKPGSAPTTTSLPRQVSRLGQLQARLALESRRLGSGNLAFDLWLTSTAQPSHFGVPPISHELMVWCDAFGSMRPAGQRRATVTIEGRAYDLYVNDKHGAGWRYIAYIPKSLAPDRSRAMGQIRIDTSINLKAFLEDARSRLLINGNAFLASVELGNELISGRGNTLLHHYRLAIR